MTPLTRWPKPKMKGAQIKAAKVPGPKKKGALKAAKVPAGPKKKGAKQAPKKAETTKKTYPGKSNWAKFNEARRLAKMQCVKDAVQRVEAACQTDVLLMEAACQTDVLPIYTDDPLPPTEILSSLPPTQILSSLPPTESDATLDTDSSLLTQIDDDVDWSKIPKTPSSWL